MIEHDLTGLQLLGKPCNTELLLVDFWLAMIST